MDKKGSLLLCIAKTTAHFEAWLINNYYDGIVITIPGTISVIT